jgi:hypothetical protein
MGRAALYLTPESHGHIFPLCRLGFTPIAFVEECPINDDLSLIQKLSDRAPHLTVDLDLDRRCYKRFGEEWAICGLTGPFRSRFKG